MFCERNQKLSDLLYIQVSQAWTFDSNGNEIMEKFQTHSQIYRSCSTFLNGEAIVIGGDFSRKVFIS